MGEHSDGDEPEQENHGVPRRCCRARQCEPPMGKATDNGYYRDDFGIYPVGRDVEVGAGPVGDVNGVKSGANAGEEELGAAKTDLGERAGVPFSGHDGVAGDVHDVKLYREKADWWCFVLLS